MTNINVSSLMGALGAQFPLIAVCVLGLVFTLVQMNRMPRIAALVSAGLGLLLFIALAQPFVQPMVQNLVMRSVNRGPTPYNFLLLYSAISFVFNLVRSVAIG